MTLVYNKVSSLIKSYRFDTAYVFVIRQAQFCSQDWLT